MGDFQTLPADLPAPVDDGACAHLTGQRWPALPLPGTDGQQHDVSAWPGRSVVYAYPKTARPDHAMPDDWDMLPGARGCTPQSCAFRNHHAELAAAGARVVGLSVQDTAYQQEAAARLHLPFALLSDADMALAQALALPTFEAGGETLLCRVTLIVRDGVIEHVFYPVFPPDRNAQDVLAWLSAHPA
ncbi:MULTISPECIES: peroxiredoxin [Deinococcus]|uniref:Peroxiredoxin n=1 Tax=Deinococcus rufus TaxID=2136097 RepID=A0ABV7Z1X6_9DEIO|nr:peroxiredoxin [Deinococcus sp. AB2017081]WQE95129.1 peroxiredoxin [Deinococcus sp. AB2017081]